VRAPLSSDNRSAVGSEAAVEVILKRARSRMDERIQEAANEKSCFCFHSATLASLSAFTYFEHHGISFVHRKSRPCERNIVLSSIWQKSETLVRPQVNPSHSSAVLHGRLQTNSCIIMSQSNSRKITLRLTVDDKLPLLLPLSP
jgi:hypothetical protein